MRLQVKAASVFLEELGGRWLPSVLLERLEAYDVVYALDSFCTQFGIKFQALLNPKDVRHRSNAKRLERLLGILASLEDAEEVLELSCPEALAALAQSIDRGEALVDHLENIASVWRFVRSTAIRWPEYLIFEKEVREAIDNWQRLTEKELSDIMTAARRYQLADALFRDLLQETQQTLSSCKLDNLDELDRRTVAGMENVARQLILDLEQGVLGIDTVLSEIQGLLQILKMFRESLDDLVDAPAPLTIECALARLDLTPPATLAEARSAYRRKAMQCHPDRLHLQDATADELKAATTEFHLITEAWEFLQKTLAR